MKHSQTTFLGLGVLVIAVMVTVMVVKFLPKGENDNISSSPKPGKLQTDRKSKRQSDVHERNSQVAEINSDQVKDPLTLAAEKEAAIEIMQDASTSYDPKELPVIRPYLESPDPEIRDAAVDAMIVLGDASAGPMIRDAAKKVSSPEERKKMEKAADYVELPSASFKEISERMKKRRAQKTKTTNESQ